MYNQAYQDNKHQDLFLGILDRKPSRFNNDLNAAYRVIKEAAEKNSAKKAQTKNVGDTDGIQLDTAK